MVRTASSLRELLFTTTISSTSLKKRFRDFVFSMTKNCEYHLDLSSVSDGVPTLIAERPELTFKHHVALFSSAPYYLRNNSGNRKCHVLCVHRGCLECFVMTFMPESAKIVLIGNYGSRSNRNSCQALTSEVD